MKRFHQVSRRAAINGLVLIFCIPVIAACGAVPSSTFTPETEATVEAAIAIIATAEAGDLATAEARTSAPTATPTMAPTPTPDLEATVEARVQQRLAEAAPTATVEPTPTPTAPPLPTPTPPALITPDLAASLLSDHVRHCVIMWGIGVLESDVRFLGEHMWFVEVTGQKGQLDPLATPASGRWDSGMWRLDEQTGDLFPYDARARNLDEAELPTCETVVIEWAQRQPATPTTTPTSTVTPTPVLIIIELPNLSICGAQIIAEDGQYLGKVSGNIFSIDSIMNEFGSYGSEFRSTSIWNEFGSYGSQFGRYSAFNDFATSPPRMFSGETFLGYITTNSSALPRVHPLVLKGWLSDDNCPFS